MAIIPATLVKTPKDGPIEVICWPSLQSGDVGEPWVLGGYRDNHLEVQGEFGTAVVTVLGTIDPAGEEGHVLTDQNGTRLFLMAGTLNLRQVLQHPYKIWPGVEGGGPDTNVTVFMLIRR